MTEPTQEPASALMAVLQSRLAQVFARYLAMALTALASYAAAKTNVQMDSAGLIQVSQIAGTLLAAGLCSYYDHWVHGKNKEE